MSANWTRMHQKEEKERLVEELSGHREFLRILGEVVLKNNTEGKCMAEIEQAGFKFISNDRKEQIKEWISNRPLSMFKN